MLFFNYCLSIGVVFIWPGILKIENRQCFVSLIKDGRDGSITRNFLPLEPNHLLKIKSAKTKYKKILLIGIIVSETNYINLNQI